VQVAGLLAFNEMVILSMKKSDRTFDATVLGLKLCGCRDE